MRSKLMSNYSLVGLLVATLAWLFVIWQLRADLIFEVSVVSVFVLLSVVMLTRIGHLASELRVHKMEANALLNKACTAESVSLIKTQFLANMSHEIRTPLSAILGFVELMDDPKLPVEERLAFSKIIRGNSEYLIKIINDILDVSKIESGKLTINSGETNLIKTISSVVSMLKVKADEKNLKLMTEYWSELPGVVLIDECRVRQILINLIGNAIKFTEQGSVSLHVGCHPLKEKGFLSLEVVVRDTGEGLSPVQKEQLFTMFTQVNTEFGDRPVGTGLGLALSRRLANIMGGEVSILESTPGKGSSFIFTLPVQVKSVNAGQSQPRRLNSTAQTNSGSSMYI